MDIFRKYRPFFGCRLLLLLVYPVYLFSQSAPSTADIFFLDLGIVIEPATGKESYSRLIETSSEEVKVRIKKVKSGAVYMAASKEMLEALNRIQQRMDDLERSFRNEVGLLRQENRELRGVLANFTAPSLPESNTPKEDLIILEEISSTLEEPIQETENQLAQPAPDPVKDSEPAFDQGVYLSGVFAYQRDDFRRAIDIFSRLPLNLTGERMVGNILYWMADSYQQLGEYDKALAVLDRLINYENAEREDDALIQKGLVYRKTGREDLALQAFSQVVNNHPGSEYIKLAKMELKKAEVIQ